MESIPARIHILLARDAPVGGVIRRGPSKRVCTMLWDRETDEFTLGQWLKGRIYERRSDISPDGKLMVYFAMNGKWKSESLGSWTAISRVPYLKAIVFLPKGDCWHGGGVFTRNNRYWLNDGSGHQVLQDSDEVHRDREFQPDAYYGGECPGVYYVRLQRRGWEYKKQVVLEEWHTVDTFEKALREGWTLRKLAHMQVGASRGKGCTWDEHELVRPKANTLLRLGKWQWAEWDRNRLVWATRGQIWTGSLTESGIGDERMLADLNDMVFEPIAAPY